MVMFKPGIFKPDIFIFKSDIFVLIVFTPHYDSGLSQKRNFATETRSSVVSVPLWPAYWTASEARLFDFYRTAENSLAEGDVKFLCDSHIYIKVPFLIAYHRNIFRRSTAENLQRYLRRPFTLLFRNFCNPDQSIFHQIIIGSSARNFNILPDKSLHFVFFPVVDAGNRAKKIIIAFLLHFCELFFELFHGLYVILFEVQVKHLFVVPVLLVLSLRICGYNRHPVAFRICFHLIYDLRYHCNFYHPGDIIGRKAIYRCVPVEAAENERKLGVLVIGNDHKLGAVVISSNNQIRIVFLNGRFYLKSRLFYKLLGRVSLGVHADDFKINTCRRNNRLDAFCYAVAPFISLMIRIDEKNLLLALFT